MMVYLWIHVPGMGNSFGASIDPALRMIIWVMRNLFYHFQIPFLTCCQDPSNDDLSTLLGASVNIHVKVGQSYDLRQVLIITVISL